MLRKLIAQQPTAIVKPLMAWFRGTAERRTLADMPDYLLRDIGLRRDQLPGLADEVAAGPAASAEGRPEPRPEPRPAAQVVDMTAARARKKPARPEKPMAA